ncbi:hypothetical protein EVG20_g9291 [Dentipellis fragilis]|uniref:C2H2-type domain-containing protein n=1 Tax=Dentipellis fragilis TaxID=205917 RepID=A0A4Y9Y2A9_9AGAM|nr:hypothetical protein EVG20_g9291 [Dentipellis fragilis]
MKMIALQTGGSASSEEESLTSVVATSRHLLLSPHPNLDPLLPNQSSSTMSHLNQPFEGDHPELAQITLTPDDVIFLREHGLHLNTQDDVGSFEFADLMHSDHAPQEPFSLTHRPDEDIFRVPPQERSTGLYSYQHMYSTEGHQNNSFFVPAHAATSAPSMPIQTQHESVPYGDAHSVPRAAWLPSSGSGYAVTAPSATLNHSDITGAQDFILPPMPAPSYASYSGSSHEASMPWNAMSSYPLPDATPTPPDPRTIPSMEQLLAHQRSMPGYDGTSAQYGGEAGYMPAETFEPIQYQDSRQTSASRRQAKSRVQSRRLGRERVAPVVPRTARARQQGSQTLKDYNYRTREIDLGGENNTGQSSQGCLLVPPRGPSVPTPAPSAGVSTGTAKVGRAAKAKASRKRRDLAMPPPHRMPPVPEIFVDGKTRYMCPWEGCGKSCARCHDTKRHYWRHVDNRPRWWCTRCDRLYTRSDNAGRHYRKIHTDDKKKAKEDIVQVNGDSTEEGA